MASLNYKILSMKTNDVQVRTQHSCVKTSCRCEHIIEEGLAVTSATHDNSSCNRNSNSGPRSSESAQAGMSNPFSPWPAPSVQQACEVGDIIIPTFQNGPSAAQGHCEDGVPGCWLQGL